MTVDLNCDMGEGMGNDEAIMPFISSANVACGYHAGDEKTMVATILLAMKYGVAIGAHPSYPDRDNFGRIDMDLPLAQVYELVKAQVTQIMELTLKAGAKLHHVKPHGALYNAASGSADLAAAVALAVKDAGSDLVLYGLSNGQLIKEAKKIGLKAANEVFADRTYDENGMLTPRSTTGALITEEYKACAQVLQMATANSVTALSGKKIPVKADTVCLHGDGVHAVAFVKAIHSTLKQAGIDIKAI